MRHGKKTNHLGRTRSHRSALMKNLSNSLIKTKRIETTLAKAKELRKYIEPLVTKGKNDTTHSRRVVFSYLQDKDSIKELFGDIAEKVASRNGGYTRIIKLGKRLGDNAETALIEFVDYNENIVTDTEEKKKSSRSRRGGKKKASDDKENVVDQMIAQGEQEEYFIEHPDAISELAAEDAAAEKAKEPKADEGADGEEAESK